MSFSASHGRGQARGHGRRVQPAKQSSFTAHRQQSKLGRRAEDDTARPVHDSEAPSQQTRPRKCDSTFRLQAKRAKADGQVPVVHASYFRSHSEPTTELGHTVVCVPRVLAILAGRQRYVAKLSLRMAGLCLPPVKTRMMKTTAIG